MKTFNFLSKKYGGIEERDDYFSRCRFSSYPTMATRYYTLLSQTQSYCSIIVAVIVFFRLLVLLVSICTIYLVTIDPSGRLLTRSLLPVSP